MTSNRVACTVVNDDRGASAAQGKPQTQTHEAQHVQRLRGRFLPWQEAQGVFVPGQTLA